MKKSIDNLHTQTKESQGLISPADAVQLLKDGNDRFANDKPLIRNLHQQVHDTSGGQFPFAAVVSCIDSRIPTEIIFDQGIGDIFNARIAGNFVNEDILGSLEFACQLAGSKLIVVMGHTSCGAVKGACDNAQLGNLTQMLDKIMPAVNSVTTAEGEARDSSNIDFVNRVSRKNVALTIANIKANSPVLNALVERNQIGIIGAMYDVGSGKVEFFSQNGTNV